MYQLKSPTELEQIKLALEAERNVVSFRGYVYIFWGLIAAKCFLAEWAVRYYQMPFRSYFVWAPTLFFGLVATWVYAGFILKAKLNRPLTGRFVAAIWGGCLMGAAMVSILGLGSGHLSTYQLPGILAVITGIGYFVHSVIDHRTIYKCAAYGWWAGSSYLFFQPNVHALAWFALLILVCQVTPATILLLQSNRPTSRRGDPRSHRDQEEYTSSHSARDRARQ